MLFRSLAVMFCDKLIMLKDGEIRHAGAAKELFTKEILYLVSGPHSLIGAPRLAQRRRTARRRSPARPRAESCAQPATRRESSRSISPRPTRQGLARQGAGLRFNMLWPMFRSLASLIPAKPHSQVSSWCLCVYLLS